MRHAFYDYLRWLADGQSNPDIGLVQITDPHEWKAWFASAGIRTKKPQLECTASSSSDRAGGRWSFSSFWVQLYSHKIPKY